MNTPLHDGFDQIAELFRCELVSFQVCRQVSIPVDDRSVKGMREISFVIPETRSKQFRHGANIGERSSQEAP
jgi:hypothetical protein